ncbi:MAG: hypothetical protein KF859_11625, partial [Phycisphaeraceae bacterium]|nr:hypothetical protein [Phycisphaeraceae bacterium]
SRTLTISGAGALYNLGLLASESGTLAINTVILSNYNATTQALTAGQWRADGGSLTIGTRPVRVISPDTEVYIRGASNTIPTFSNLSVVDGTLHLVGRTLSTTPNDETLLVSGTLTLGANGSTASLLAVTGGVVFEPSTSLRVDLAGLAPAQFGRVTATTIASLAGTLGGRFAPPYVPTAGHTFDIITAPLVIGDFETDTCFDANPQGLGVAALLLPSDLRLTVDSTTGAFPAITQGPEVLEGCIGSAVLWAAAGPGDVTFQWFKNGQPLEDGETGNGSAYLGTDTDTLVIVDATYEDEGTYSLRVANVCGESVSEIVSLNLCLCLECPADFNQDGGIDGADVSAFFQAWEEGSCDADVNSDGGVDGEDVNTFFFYWEAGGC